MRSILTRPVFGRRSQGEGCSTDRQGSVGAKLVPHQQTMSRIGSPTCGQCGSVFVIDGHGLDPSMITTIQDLCNLVEGENTRLSSQILGLGFFTGPQTAI